MEERHQQELGNIEIQFKALKKQSEDKDLLIRTLQECILEKEKTINTIVASIKLPKELVINWTAFEKFLTR